MALASSPDLTKKRFLVVDDYEGMRGILRDILSRAGAKAIDFAANGLNALAALDRNEYDVVLCDLHLGSGINGLQVLEEARARELLGPAAVWLIISSEKTPEMITGIAEAKPDDYLIKPITESTLISRLHRQITKKHALEAIEQAIREHEYLKAMRLADARATYDRSHARDLQRILAELSLLTGQTARAQGIFEQVLAEREIPWALLGLAKIRAQEGDLEAARKLLQMLSDSHPTYLEGHDWLARILEQQGEWKAAQDVLERAVSISPLSPGRQTRLGQAAFKSNDLDTAETALKKAIGLYEHVIRKSPEPYLGLTRVYVEKKDTGQALKTLGSLASDMKGDETARLLARAMEIPVRMSAQDRDGARAIAAEVAGAMRENSHQIPPEVAFELAAPLMELGDKTSAAALLSSVVGNNHDHPELVERAQAVFTQAGLEEEGRQVVQAATRAATEIMNKGVQLSREGKLDEALAMMRQARKRLPYNPRLLLNQAFLLIVTIERRGHQPELEREARDCIETARRLKPDDKRVGELLAKLELLDSNFNPA